MVHGFLNVWKELKQPIFDLHVYETAMSQSQELKLE